MHCAEISHQGFGPPVAQKKFANNLGQITDLQLGKIAVQCAAK